MSKFNGDKARSHRIRKKRISQRKRVKQLVSKAKN